MTDADELEECLHKDAKVAVQRACAYNLIPMPTARGLVQCTGL